LRKGKEKNLNVPKKGNSVEKVHQVPLVTLQMMMIADSVSR